MNDIWKKLYDAALTVLCPERSQALSKQAALPPLDKRVRV